MGLSDEERFAGVVHVVDALSRMERFTEHGLHIINGSLDEVWPALLSKSRNAAHWLIGSESSADHLSERSILAVAFKKSLVEYEAEPYKDTPTYWRRNYLPDAEKLIGGEQGRLWRIVQLIEGYFYKANRYEDDFSQSLAALTRVMCDLRGKVHGVVSCSPVYAIGWMLQALLEKCFPYDDEDLVTRAGAKFNWHHDLHAKYEDKAFVHEAFKKYQFADMAERDRLAFVLRLLGHGFHYDHQHQELLALVRESNAKRHTIEDLRAQGIRDEEIRGILGLTPFVWKNWLRCEVSEAAVRTACKAASAKRVEYEASLRGRYATSCSFTETTDERLR